MRLTKHILTLALYALAMFALPKLTYQVVTLFGVQDRAAIIVTMNTVSYAFMAVVCLKLHGKSLLDDLKRITSFPKFLVWITLGWIGLLIMAFLAGLVIYFLRGGSQQSLNQQSIDTVRQAYPFLMGTTTIILAPFIEEMVFRRSLMTALERFPLLSILASTLLFGLIHVISGGDYIFLISYAAMGFPLTIAYFKTRNICYPIGIHMMQNTYAVLMMILSYFLI